MGDQDLRLGFYLLLSLSRMMQHKTGIERDDFSDKSDLISFYMFSNAFKLDIAFN